MANLAIRNPKSEIRNGDTPAPPSGWLSVAEAAAILGVDPRTVRRHCAEGRLTAMQVAANWWVDPQCEPALRLATGDEPGLALAGSGLAALTEAQRQRAFDRLEVVRSYEAALAHRPGQMPVQEFTSRWVETWNLYHADRRTSRPTLYRWLAAYKAKGIAGLIDRRGGARRVEAFSAEAKEFCLGLYLKESNPSVPYIYALAESQAREHGWRLPSKRTVQKFLRLKVDTKLLAAGRDPKRFRDRCLPYIRRDWTKVPAMQCWVADHRIIDVLLPRKMWNAAKKRDEIRWHRPWITMWLDARTWMPMGWIIDFDAPDANRVMAAFLKAVMLYGCPEHVILDNGKDFKAYDFAGGRSWKKEYETVDGRLRKIRKSEKLLQKKHVAPLLQSLGVEPHFAIPFNARAKVIERWFGVMAQRFDKAWPTYCGRSPAHRPEGLKRLRADRVDPELNLANFREAFSFWAMDDFALRASPAEAAGGRSPLRAISELRSPEHTPVRPAAETAALLLARSQRVQVRRNGLWVAAFSGFYWSGQLEDRRAASGNDVARHVVYRYIPDYPSAVFVFDFRTDRFLCIAEPYIGEGVHPLAAASGDDAEIEVGKLGDAMGLQRRLARDTNAEVRRLRKHAAALLLDAQRRAGMEAGLLDDPASIRTRPAPVIKMIGDGELDRAAQAGLEHKRRAAQPSAREFLLTGTDDDPEPARQQATDVLGLLVAGSQEPVVGKNEDPATDYRLPATKQKGSENESSNQREGGGRPVA